MMWWWWLVFCLRGVEKGMPRMPTESTGGKERKEPCTTEREQRRCLGTWQQRKDGTRLRNWFTLNIEEVKWKRAECWVGSYRSQEPTSFLSFSQQPPPPSCILLSTPHHHFSLFDFFSLFWVRRCQCEAVGCLFWQKKDKFTILDLFSFKYMDHIF